MKNLSESIFRELESYYKLEKDLITNKDLERIEYLLEQSIIAKAQGIKVQSIIEKEQGIKEKNDNLPLDLAELRNKKNIMDGLILNINSNNNTYSSDYLRGYKAIDIEIDLIRNRKYVLLENIREEIDLLKKKNVRWVDYNIFLLETEMQIKNETSLSLFKSLVILFSLIIGVVYTYISTASQFHVVARKKKTK